MEQQNAYLDLTILSATDLKRNWLSGDQTVAVAWVDSSSKKTTKVASGGGSNAEWHEKLTLSLNGADALARGKQLTIEIHSRGNWGNSLLGTVYVPLLDLALDGQKGANTILTYQIVQPSGKRDGSLNFVAKVVKPSGITGDADCKGMTEPFATADNRLGSGFNTLYPPVGTTYPSVEIHDEAPESSPYSPHQSLVFQKHTPKHDAWQHVTSPYPSYRMASYPPQLYPPVNTANPSYNPSAHCTCHSNYSSIAPYPPPAQHLSEAPYRSPSSVYPPPASPFSEAPYPPTSLYPPRAPHSSEAPYPPTSLYPYPAHPSTSLYPPPYPPRHA